MINNPAIHESKRFKSCMQFSSFLLCLASLQGRKFKPIDSQEPMVDLLDKLTKEKIDLIYKAVTKLNVENFQLAQEALDQYIDYVTLDSFYPKKKGGKPPIADEKKVELLVKLNLLVWNPNRIVSIARRYSLSRLPNELHHYAISYFIKNQQEIKRVLEEHTIINEKNFITTFKKLTAKLKSDAQTYTKIPGMVRSSVAEGKEGAPQSRMERSNWIDSDEVRSAQTLIAFSLGNVSSPTNSEQSANPIDLTSTSSPSEAKETSSTQAGAPKNKKRKMN